MIISLAVRLAEIKIETVGNTLAVLEAMALFDTLAERHSEKEFNPHTLFELEAAAQVNTIAETQTEIKVEKLGTTLTQMDTEGLVILLASKLEEVEIETLGDTLA